MINVGLLVSSNLIKKESLFASGIAQNNIFLFKLLRKNPEFKARIFCARMDKKEPISNGWKEFGIRDDEIIVYEDLEKCKDAKDVDVVIESGLWLTKKDLLFFKKRGTKIINYAIGNGYIFFLERTLFGPPENHDHEWYRDVDIDRVWTLPHHYKTCKSFFEVRYGSDVKKMPYIWDSCVLQKKDELSISAGKGSIKYSAGPDKSISIFEPNRNCVKTNFIPMIICEKVHKKNSSLINHVSVFNTQKIKSSNMFSGFANKLTITKDKKISYENTYELPFVLRDYTDIVVSHQWENELNNIYFELLYLGYPLIHNSLMLKDAGYFYPDFDAEKGAEQLILAVQAHDNQLEEYAKASNQALWDASIDNDEVAQKYYDEIKDLAESSKKRDFHDKKKYSVIMMSYLGDYEGSANHRKQKFIRAVNSFLSQKYKNIELVIISDGCDQTRKIYEKNFSKFKNIIYVHAERDKTSNKWPGKLRQEGIKIASGDRILYLDSDDAISYDHIYNIDKNFAEDLDWIVCEGIMAPVKDGVPTINKNFSQISDNTWQKSRWGSSEVDKICIGNICHNKSLDVSWDHEGIGEDVMFTKALLKDFKYKKFDAYTYYVCHGASLDKDGRRKVLFDV